MFRKLLFAPGFAAVLLTASMTTPAVAKQCLFVAINQPDIRGVGNGLSQRAACRRAERRCLGNLRRAWQKGKAQQLGCKRIDQGLTDARWSGDGPVLSRSVRGDDRSP
jgi:hypothetical protein